MTSQKKRSEEAESEEESATFPPELLVGGFSSDHNGDIVIMAFGDGHVRPISASIDQQLLQSLGHRNDGQLVSLEDLD